jgi:hypothetical protein
MKIFRTDRFRFLYYDTVFYIKTPFPNFAKHKNLSFSTGFTTIFLYSLIAKNVEISQTDRFRFLYCNTDRFHP